MGTLGRFPKLIAFAATITTMVFPRIFDENNGWNPNAGMLKQLAANYHPLSRMNFNGNKRNVPESMKKFVAAKQKWTCKSCNEMLDATYEIDHIRPLYQGGDNQPYNLQALCRNCHGRKTMNDRLSLH